MLLWMFSLLTITLCSAHDRHTGSLSSSLNVSKHALIASTIVKGNKNKSTVSPFNRWNELRLALDNEQDIRRNHGCSKPRGRLMAVQTLTNELRPLIPRYVYLHRCDESSGCCASPDEKCVASAQQIVFKHFYALTGASGSARVVRLGFVNHTTCSCRFDNLQDDLDESLRIALSMSHRIEKDTDRRSARFDCAATIRCASPFHFQRTPISDRESRSSCSCLCAPGSGNKCQRFISGQERLDDVSLRCVRRSLCQMPVCLNHYHFDLLAGRCLPDI